MIKITRESSRIRKDNWGWKVVLCMTGFFIFTISSGFLFNFADEGSNKSKLIGIPLGLVCIVLAFICWRTADKIISNY